MRLVTWWVRLGVIVVAGALIVSSLVVGVAPRLWNILNAHEEGAIGLPEWESIAQRTYVYDSQGNEIAAYELENSQPVSLAQVPDDVIDAILAVEDREFYNHHGVNVRGLFRATLSNFEGGARQGASTITQQVVKMEYLAGLERDGRYKILQIIDALRLEKVRTKDEILERYLNTVFFGNNTYGIQAAAEVYFGKRVEALTLVDGAFLAGLIQAPSTYDPIRHPQQSRRRFGQALDALVDEGLLDTVVSEEIKFCLIDSEDPGDQVRCEGGWRLPEVVQQIDEERITRTHFSEEVKSYLLNKSNLLGDTYQERYNRLFRGGLRIHTTLDPVAQAAAEKARLEQLPSNTAGIDTAIVSLDSKTGAVRAMVTRPFVTRNSCVTKKEPDGTPSVDKEGNVIWICEPRNQVNMALAPRQTGSSIKIFILAAAVAAGAQGDDVIDGTLPCTLPNPDDPDNPFVATDGVSRPVGSLSEMTWASINCAYARLSQIVGLDRVVDTTYRMANNLYLFQGRSPEQREPLRPYASFATGANEMSPLDMASGAQTLANGGVHMQPYYIERIEGPDGVLYQHSDAGVQVLSPEANARAVNILEGVLISGTARRSQLEGRVSAGKTGTQDNNTNAWMVGFTPELTTAVWVGHPDLYLPMNGIPEFVAAGVDRVIGGTFPARIWKATMDGALAGKPATLFPTPPPNARASMRLYLPGSDCPTVVTVPTTAPTATTTPGDPGAPTTVAPTTTTSTTSTTSTTVVAPPGVITDINTTIPRGQVDPTWPLPTLPADEYTFPACP